MYDTPDDPDRPGHGAPASPSGGADAEGGTALPVDREALRAIVDGAIRRYVAERRARVEPFVEANFRFGPALRLHRKAAGWDMVRAPANLALAGPHLALKAAAAGSRAAGWRGMADRIDRQPVFLTSDVAREVEWRVFTEFLELPYAQPGRRFERDALAEALFADPALAEPMAEALQAVGRRADDPAFRAWLTDTMTAYASTRTAAADIANVLVSAGVGALAFKQLTPGMISLGPAMAQALAHHAAVASFPLGAGIGGLWYGAVPVGASAGLVVGLTGGLMAVASMLTAFSGALTDPIQVRLGLHQRRLHRLLDTLERNLTGDSQARYVVRDHYVARLFDILDMVRAAHALAR
ncbi:MAG: hypothetical protein RID91_00635 [Azospirillaceae bacterium]